MKVDQFIIVIFISSTLMTTSGQTASVLTVQQAEEWVRNGKAAEAAESLREIAQKNPEDLYALYNYGVACYANEDYLEASKAFGEISRSEDKALWTLAMTQMGNAQYRLGEALLKHNKPEAAMIAWERAVDHYTSGLEEKPDKNTRTNLKIVGQKYKTLLVELGEKRLKQGRESDQHRWRVRYLSEALVPLEKAAAYDPEDAVVQALLKEAEQLYAQTMAAEARKNREQAYELNQKANALAEKAVSEDNQKKKKQLLKEARKHRHQENRERQNANENYQRALQSTPDDQALQQEFADYKTEQADYELNDAKEYLAEADVVEEKDERRTLEKQESLLNQALERIDTAMELDPGNKEGEQLRAQTRQRLEANAMAQARSLMEYAAEVAERAKERSVGPYAKAAENYRKALEQNSENQEAKQGVAEAEQALAEAYMAAGEKELATAEAMMAATRQPPADAAVAKQKKQAASENSPADQKQPSKSPKEPGLKELQEQIGHLEKAAQSFAQAEAIAPGQTDSEQRETEATEKLNDVRNQLDQVLAASNAAENAAMAQNESSESSSESDSDVSRPSSKEPSSQAAIAQNPSEKESPEFEAIQILSFSEVRGKSSSGKGAFEDRSEDKFIRDW